MYPRILQKFDNYLVKTVYKYANRKWFKNPFGKKVFASKQEYLRIWEKAKTETFPVIDKYEKDAGFSIDSDFFHKLALHTQVVIKKSDILYVHGRLLYSTIRKYIKDNSSENINIIETGTARGFSSICMAKAVEDSEIHAKIVTYDVLPHHHKMYWNCIDDHDGKKTRADILHPFKELCEKYILFHQGNSITEMKKIGITRIHFAFLDGGHDYYHVINEFKNIIPFQNRGDIIFFDDYTPGKFSGVVKAVNEICEIYNYDKQVISVNKSRAYVIARKQ